MTTLLDAGTQLRAGDRTYSWIENWASIPQTRSGKANGRTHGVVAAGNGDILVFCQAQPAVLRFDPSGRLVNAWGDRFHGAHGMTLVHEGDEALLWLTDQNSGEVVKTTLDGETVMSLQRPDHAIYRAGKSYVPTWVSVNEEGHGGTGDIWITDGYGSGFIHRYTKAGAYVSSINGTEGKAGAFACPHAIRFLYHAGRPELYVADRGNRRVQAYDAEGRFLRAFGSEYLTSPCMFDVDGDRILIPELFGRVTVIDQSDRLIGHLGANPGIEKTSGWPELPRAQIRPGHFNSPHAMTADGEGNLYVVEWLVGGRITKLARV